MGPSAAMVAARCGYHDQAHLTREWQDLAGARQARGWPPNSSQTYKTPSSRDPMMVVMNSSAVQDQITAFWNVVAPHYDSPDNVAQPDSVDYQHWVAALRSVLPGPPAEVLDVGTGTGFVARIAAELGHQVTAIDTSSAMLGAAVARDCSNPITYALGDAVAPAFPAESFDVVLSRSLLWTLRDPEAAFRNWYRLLKPGGRMVAVYGHVGSHRARVPNRGGQRRAARLVRAPLHNRRASDPRGDVPVRARLPAGSGWRRGIPGRQRHRT